MRIGYIIKKSIQLTIRNPKHRSHKLPLKQVARNQDHLGKEREAYVFGKWSVDPIHMVYNCGSPRSGWATTFCNHSVSKYIF